MADRQSTSEPVKQLMEMCGSTPGEAFTWAAIEEILTPLTRHDRRFRTITRAWIRHLRKWHNRKMVVVPGIGMRILYERERADDVCATLGRTYTDFDRAKTDVDDIQIVELTQPECDTAHHVRLITHRLHHAMQEERMRLSQRPDMPGPSPSRPQVQVA
jgi:hypothetical protein